MKNPIGRLVGRKVVKARPMTSRECLLMDAEGGFVIEFDGCGDAIHITTKTLDCEKFPSEERWTEVDFVSVNGCEVTDLTEPQEVSQ